MSESKWRSLVVLIDVTCAETYTAAPLCTHAERQNGRSISDVDESISLELLTTNCQEPGVQSGGIRGHWKLV